jgi:hypothetical protein
MPNFGPVRPVRGQYKLPSAYMQDRAQEHPADAQRQIRDMRLQAPYQKRADREIFRMISQRAGADVNKAGDEMFAARADPRTSFLLKDRARGDAVRADTDKQRGQAESDRRRNEVLEVAMADMDETSHGAAARLRLHKLRASGAIAVMPEAPPGCAA